MAIDSTDTIARAPTGFENASDRGFRGLTRVLAVLAVGLVFWLVAQIAWTAHPAIEDYGAGFLVDSKWSPGTKEFGTWRM